MDLKTDHYDSYLPANLLGPYGSAMPTPDLQECLRQMKQYLLPMDLDYQARMHDSIDRQLDGWMVAMIPMLCRSRATGPADPQRQRNA